MGILEFEKSFAVFAGKVAKWTGSSAVFSLAFLSILVWGVTGPYFGFSEGGNWSLTPGQLFVLF